MIVLVRILRIPSSSSSSCGGGGSPPLLPARSDSLSSREEAELRLAPWFQAGIPREVMISLISNSLFIKQYFYLINGIVYCSLF